MEKQFLQFKIDGFTPETLPMERLAAYMAELAVLFANSERVHFDKVRRGSALLQAWVEATAAPKIRERVSIADSPDAPEDIARSYQVLNKMLREDNSTGVLRRPRGAIILRFPGKKAPVIRTFRVVENGTIEGFVIRIGGIDETVPIWIRNREGEVVKNCHTRNLQAAKELGKYYLGPFVRFEGVGKWLRNDEEKWQLEEFIVNSFEVLDEVPLGRAVDAVRAVEGNAWNEYEDPQAELRKVREGK
jgi:hypothetical protein